MCVDDERRPLPARAVRQRPLPAGGDEALRARATPTRCCSSGGSGSHSGHCRGRQLWSAWQSCSLFLNVNGFVDDPEILAQARLRAFLDIDPGFGQMWRELGLHDAFRGPRRLRDGRREHRRGRTARSPPAASTGSRRRSRSCSTHWPVTDARRASASRASGAGAARSGRSSTTAQTYGLRVHEFRQFAALPALVRPAVRGRARHRRGRRGRRRAAARRTAGRWPTRAWSRATPGPTATTSRAPRASSWSPRTCTSRSRSGWFSDRSICYLASGRPVLAQDTGLLAALPRRATACCRSAPWRRRSPASRDIARDYAAHCAAARAARGAALRLRNGVDATAGAAGSSMS